MVIITSRVPAILALLASTVPYVYGYTVPTCDDGSGSGQGNHHVQKPNGGCPDGMKKIIHTNFNQWSAGRYTPSRVQADFGTGTTIYSEGEQDSARIVKDERGNHVLRIKYKAGCSGQSPGCTLHFKTDLGGSFNKVYYSMDLDFGGTWGKFQWVKGGKLPGICGGTCNTGGRIPNGYDGFSDRIMWRADGHLMSYVYDANMPGPWGTNMMWNTEAPQQTWVNVAQMVEMNNPNKSNGKITSWVNGKEMISRDNVTWRYTKDLAVDKFYFSTFFGGHGPSWAPSSDMSIFFNDILICAA